LWLAFILKKKLVEPVLKKDLHPEESLLLSRPTSSAHIVLALARKKGTISFHSLFYTRGGASLLHDSVKASLHR
jgi:hypothetical protein